jgi:BolA protein
MEIRDDSSKHAGHAAMRGGNTSETHFHVLIVSAKFEGKIIIERHRIVN